MFLWRGPRKKDLNEVKFIILSGFTNGTANIYLDSNSKAGNKLSVEV